MPANEKIIIALDMDSEMETQKMIEILVPYVSIFKINIKLITAVGTPCAVKCVHGLGGQVFLDGKFHDTPDTIEGAARAAAKLNVKMFNVHAQTGLGAMKRAVANKGNSMVLAVTFLSSLQEHDANIDFCRPIKDVVSHFALSAQEAGCDGIICAPRDLVFLADQNKLKNVLRVAVGNRPKWAPADDQKRFMTPFDAIKAGADYLVIGRPVTKPSPKIGTPVDAIKYIIEEVENALIK